MGSVRAVKEPRGIRAKVLLLIRGDYKIKEKKKLKSGTVSFHSAGEFLAGPYFSTIPHCLGRKKYWYVDDHYSREEDESL